jgi:thiol:disulfide interchange protein DsbD
MKVLVIACVAALAACGAAAPGDAGPKAPPVSAQLLADVAAVRPGQTFTVGVLLKLQPGWHVYWKNPGESGLPTAVAWTVPEGFTVGGLQWPVPTRFSQPGDILGYGYEGEVMLLAAVTAPAQLPAGSPVTIAADASWLSCEKVCIPGKARVDLKLPAGEAPAVANEALFAQWRARVPVAATDPGSPATARVDAAGGVKQAYTIDLAWRAPARDVQWFPAADQALDLGDVKVETEGERTRITFTASVFEGLTPASSVMETVVGYRDASGARRGVTVPVEIAPGPRAGGASQAAPGAN